MALLTYTTLSPPLSRTAPPYFYAGSFIRDLVGEGFIKLSWGIVVVSHSVESLYTAILVKRHRTPFGVGVSNLLPSLTICCLSTSLGHVYSGDPLVRLPWLGGVEEERSGRQDRFYSQGEMIMINRAVE